MDEDLGKDKGTRQDILLEREEGEKSQLAQ